MKWSELQLMYPDVHADGADASTTSPAAESSAGEFASPVVFFCRPQLVVILSDLTPYLNIAL